MIKHQKIHGSDFVELSEGSIQVLATSDPDISELTFVERLSGSRVTTARGSYEAR